MDYSSVVRLSLVREISSMNRYKELKILFIAWLFVMLGLILVFLDFELIGRIIIYPSITVAIYAIVIGNKKLLSNRK